MLKKGIVILMKRVLGIMCIVAMLLCGCSASNAQSDSTTDESAKKDQYAIIQNCDNGENTTILPDNEHYEAVVEQLAYAAAYADHIDISDEMMPVKNLTFYQVATETSTSSNDKDGMVPIIDVKIYSDGNKQYATGSISPVSNIETSFEMSDELVGMIESMEKAELKR